MSWKNALAVTALSVSTTTLAGSPGLPPIVLVHGAFEDASVWTPVVSTLRKDGFETIAITLPGRGTSSLPSAGATLTLYRDTVMKIIDHLSGPVVLVGHSFGGMTISNVAEAEPQKIRTLVYVAAYLPKDGQSLTDLSQSDKYSQMGPSFRISADKTSASIDQAARGGLFCNDCTAAQQEAVSTSIISEPLAPLAMPVRLTADRFGVVDKVYIHTARDLVVSPSLQKAMVAATPVRIELTVDSGHSPFVSKASDLAKAIEAAARAH